MFGVCLNTTYKVAIFMYIKKKYIGRKIHQLSSECLSKNTYINQVLYLVFYRNILGLTLWETLPWTLQELASTQQNCLDKKPTLSYRNITHQRYEWTYMQEMIVYTPWQYWLLFCYNVFKVLVFIISCLCTCSTFSPCFCTCLSKLFTVATFLVERVFKHQQNTSKDSLI